QHCRTVPMQHPRKYRIRGRGHDAVSVATRRTMEAEQRRVIAQGHGERGWEGAEVGQILWSELRGAPLLDLKPATTFLIKRGQPDGTERYDIAIAHYGRTTEIAQSPDHLMGLGPKSRHITQTDHSINPRVLKVGKHGVQRGEVAVDVRDDR